MSRIKNKAILKEYAENHQICEVPRCGHYAMHVHHILFRSHLGGDIPENLIALCIEHHEQAHGLRHPKLTREQLLKIKSSKKPKELSH